MTIASRFRRITAVCLCEVSDGQFREGLKNAAV